MLVQPKNQINDSFPTFQILNLTARAKLALAESLRWPSGPIEPSYSMVIRNVGSARQAKEWLSIRISSNRLTYIG